MVNYLLSSLCTQASCFALEMYPGKRMEVSTCLSFGFFLLMQAGCGVILLVDRNFDIA